MGVLAAVAALLVLLYLGMQQPLAGAPGGVGVNSVGAAAAVRPRPAPAISLATFEGRSFRLADQRGKLVVVNFWASWCPPCRDEAAALERIWQARRDAGDVVLVGVNLWDRAPDAQRFLKQFGITYPNAPDGSGETAIAYGVQGLPETFFVDRQGQLVRKWIGPLSEGQLAATLDELAR